MTELELPEAQLDVMVCLWQRGPQTASALREALATRRPMTHASVSTLLTRLTRKGFVAREKGQSGKAFVFRAAIEPTPIQRKLVGSLLDRVFGGSGVALVAALLESRRPNTRELDELSALVEELRQAKQRSSDSKAKSPRK